MAQQIAESIPMEHSEQRSPWRQAATFFTARLYPRISAKEFIAYFAVASVGGVIAGVLGVFHDLWTFSIGPEYFTKVKFKSFWFANLGLGDRPFAASVGFLAAGCVGFFVAWFLARRFWNSRSPAHGIRKIVRGFMVVFLSVVVAECLGYSYGSWRGPYADYAAWYWAIDKYQIQDAWSFVRVAYIHNSAYLGGGIGLGMALLWIRPTPSHSDKSNIKTTNSR